MVNITSFITSYGLQIAETILIVNEPSTKIVQMLIKKYQSNNTFKFEICSIVMSHHSMR